MVWSVRYVRLSQEGICNFSFPAWSVRDDSIALFNFTLKLLSKATGRDFTNMWDVGGFLVSATSPLTQEYPL